MKNLHLIPTKKGQIITKTNKGTFLLGSVVAKDYVEIRKGYSGFHLCITSDEEIKNGDWFVLFSDKNNIRIEKCTSRLGDKTSIWFNHSNLEAYSKYCKKIILTTDQDLISNGIKQISDDMLLKIIEHINSGKNIDSFDEL